MTRLGLVERLRNGGQTDLADMADEVVQALREYDDAFTEFDPGDRACRARMRLAVVKARAALARATGA